MSSIGNLPQTLIDDPQRRIHILLVHHQRRREAQRAPPRPEQQQAFAKRAFRQVDLTLCRLTPDLIYDQMIAAGCARKLVFSWAGNPGVGSLHAFRRAVEGRGAPRLEIEEYSHFGMVARFAAGAARLPFWPLRNYMGTDLPRVNPRIRHVTCPYTGEALATVPALNPDRRITHAQRADAQGNTQIWGLL